MKRLRNQTVLILLTAVLLNCSKPSEKSEYLPFYETADFTPIWLSNSAADELEFHTIPDFTFTNQLGEEVTEQTFEDKIYVADFFFTTCQGICPKMTANMFLVQKAFLDDPEVLLLSHSVTPEVDNVERLQEFANERGVIANKWHLITGGKEAIYSLGRTSYFVEEDLGLEKSNDEFLHTENLVLIDKNRRIRGIYNGLKKAAVAQLIEDIKVLKEES